MRTYFSNLAAKPHKLFFFGAILNALLTMVLMLLSYLGVLRPKLDLSVYHAYSMMFAVFTQFFAAFLLTMYPRFLATDPIAPARYVPIFWVLNASAFMLALALAVAGQLAPVAGVGLFVAYVMIYRLLSDTDRQSEVMERTDTNWVLGILWLGGVAQLLFLLQLSGLEYGYVRNFAINGAFFLYVFMLVLTLSQKMIPFFTEGKVVGYKVNKSSYFLHLMLALLVIKVCLASMQPTAYAFVLDLLLFAVTTVELIRWRLPLFRVDPMLWVLYLALLWMPVGFLFYFLDGLNQWLWGNQALVFEKTPLHAIAIGYFTTLVVGFGSRIILGHAGQKPSADRYTVFLFCLIQVTVVSRVVAGMGLNLSASLYVDMIIGSAVLWLLLFGLWSRRYLRLLCV